MKSNYLFFSLFACLFLSACFRLDNNLFNPDNKITEYLLDNNPKSNAVVLDSTYNIAKEKIHLFTLLSDNDGDMAKIYAIYLGDTSRIATDTVIVYCHGNAANMDTYWTRAKLLANIGGKNRYGVLMMDYRGYGLSEGKPSESGLYADVDACVKWLKNKGLTDNRLIMYGFSLGTAPATELTANPRSLKPSKLLLEAPFASAEVMGQDASLLNLPGSALTNLKIDNAEEIKKINQPFCWMHGIDDHFLAIATHGEVVYQNYKGTYSEPYRIAGAHHSDLPAVWGLENYKKTVGDFLKR